MASARSILRQSSLVRIGYGLGSWLAPDVMFRAFGLPPAADDTRYLNAAFGGRDFTVAGVTEAALRNGRERDALLVNASCEVTDLVALLLEARRRGGLDRVLLLGVGFNVLGWISVARAARATRGD